MSRLLLLSFLGLISFSPKIFGYGMGLSSYPLKTKGSILTTELISFFSDGKGLGLQGRYTRKINGSVTLDGGIGVSDSGRNQRYFAGADIEFFPDYGKQPRISVKAFFQSAEEFEKRKNIIGGAPMASKGFAMFGKMIHPFIAAPVGLVLDQNTKQYEFRITGAFGIMGNIPVGDPKENKQLVYNVEANLNIQDSYSAIYFGISSLL